MKQIYGSATGIHMTTAFWIAYWTDWQATYWCDNCKKRLSSEQERMIVCPKCGDGLHALCGATRYAVGEPLEPKRSWWARLWEPFLVVKTEYRLPPGDGWEQ